MPSLVDAETNKEISQLIKQAVPEMHKEGDEVRFGSFDSEEQSFVFWLEFIDINRCKSFFLLATSTSMNN